MATLARLLALNCLNFLRQVRPIPLKNPMRKVIAQSSKSKGILGVAN
ncbi:MAG TPA: hypothetical protein VNW15_15435 [Rhizomicrobium sp.]|nr:hypothetical protein [Rhizomicrobium sp.]